MKNESAKHSLLEAPLQQNVSLQDLDQVYIQDVYADFEGIAPVPKVVIGLGITFCMKGTPHILPNLIDVINEYFSLAQGKVVRLSKGERAAHPLKPEEWPIPQMSVEEFRQNSYASMRATNSISYAEPGHYQFRVTFRDRDWERTNLQATFPVGFVLDQKPGFFINLLKRWSKKLNPLHGYAGFVANIPMIQMNEQSYAACTLYHVLRRFPGLNFYTYSDANNFPHGLKSADWFTCIHNDLLEQIGGSEAFAELDSEHFTVHPYPEGIMVQAGILPELGDFAQGLVPQYYGKVHDIIKPLYYPLKSSIVPPVDAFESSKEFALKWRNRFESPIPFTKFRI